MNEAEFDRYAEQYESLLARSIALSGEEPEYFAEYKIRDLAREVARSEARRRADRAGEALRICDFGSGIGGSVPFVRKHLPGADLTCLDVSERSLAIAERRFPSLARYVRLDGSSLPFPADHFDYSFAACVFHHVERAERGALMKELLRTLRPGGSLLVFEHNPWNPLTVRAVRDCPFDENAELIAAPAMKRLLAEAGFASIEIRYRVFFPHALRFLRGLERAMRWIPIGAQYCAIGRR